MLIIPSKERNVFAEANEMSTRYSPNPLDISSNDPNCNESDTTKASSELLPTASLETVVLQCVSHRDSREYTSSPLQLAEINQSKPPKASCCVDTLQSRLGSKGESGKLDITILYPTCGPDKISSGTTDFSNSNITKANSNNRYRPRKRQCLAPPVMNDDATCIPRRKYKRRNSFVMVFPTTEFLNEVQSSINDDC